MLVVKLLHRRYRVIAARTRTGMQSKACFALTLTLRISAAGHWIISHHRIVSNPSQLSHPLKHVVGGTHPPSKAASQELLPVPGLQRQAFGWQRE